MSGHPLLEQTMTLLTESEWQLIEILREQPCDDKAFSLSIRLEDGAW